MDFISQEPEDLNEDLLSNIPADPLVTAHYLQDVDRTGLQGFPYTQAIPISGRTLSLHEDILVDHLVAQSEHAQPLVIIGPQHNVFAPKDPSSSPSLTHDADSTNQRPSSALDSGYVSQISKSLMCTVCSKTFKNRAEEK